MTGERFFPRIGLMLAGMLVWAAHFTLVYGFAALVCAGRIADRTVAGHPLIAIFAVAATVAGLALILLAAAVAVGRWRRRDDDHRPADGFMAAMTWLFGAGGAIAVVFTAMSALLTPICGA